MDERRTIVTINARDFRRLAERSNTHPGIIVIPSGGSPDFQLKVILAAVCWGASRNEPNGLSNRYLEVDEEGEVVVTELIYKDSNNS